MPIFQYTARDTTGKLSTGEVEAENDSGVAALLRDQGLWPTNIKLQSVSGEAQQAVSGGPDRSFLRRLWSPVSHHDLSLFYRQLYTLLHSGVPLYQALEMLSQPVQCTNGHLRKVIITLSRQVLVGGRFSEPMYQYPWLFDRMQIRMVEVLMPVGLMDAVCPPSTQFAAYNKIRAPKSLLIYPDFGHETLPGAPDRIFDFLAEL